MLLKVNRVFKVILEQFCAKMLQLSDLDIFVCLNNYTLLNGTG